MAKKIGQPLDLESIADQVRLLAKDVDFAQLEKEGLLRKHGVWYEVPDIYKLPKYVTVKAREYKTVKGKTLVKFEKASSFEKIAKKFKKMGL